MIFLNRDRVPKPKILEERAPAELQNALDRVSSEAAKSGHAKFDFRLYRHPNVKEALEELFNGKCAFCESKSRTTVPLEVEHFRPKQRCLDQHGNHFPLHYFWLASEWRNFYSICTECNRAKKTRFPISGERASVDNPVYDPQELFEIESPLLLDPCREKDFPEQQFVYSENGEISSDTERGRMTIEVFGLNRSALVEARKRNLEGLQGHIANVEQLISDMDDGRTAFDEKKIAKQVDRVLRMTRDETEFAGMCRQYAKRFVDELDQDSGVIEEDGAVGPGWKPEESDGLDKARYVSSTEQAQVSEEFKKMEQVAQSYSLEEGAQESYFSRSQTIERVVLKNFRPIEELTLEIRSPEATPWTMLLGENGCGKSSILKAIALTLMGEKYREDPRLGLDASSFVRYGTESGYVEVYLSGLNEPIRMTFEAGETHFEGGEASKVLLFAYGATRLLPRSEPPSRGTRYARVDNLFDPFVPMEDARRWLLDLPPNTFAEVKPALKQLLNLGEEDDLSQDPIREQIDVTLYGDTVSLEQLSDGYQTVVAVAAELMSVLLREWQDVASAEGIVLLDEVGSHLHPSWRMRIIESLRTAFPSVQFIVTTHNPLCLRGMREGEVVVMQRDPEGKVVTQRDLPSPESMRIDQILQSDFFGLSSTVDVQVNRLYDRYYELLMIQERSNEQDQELASIKDRLQEKQEFGDTERERIMLETIDEYRVQQSLSRQTEVQHRLGANTRQELKDLWAKVRTETAE